MDLESVFGSESFPSKEKGSSVSVHQAEVALRLSTNTTNLLTHTHNCPSELESLAMSRDAQGLSEIHTHTHTIGYVLPVFIMVIMYVQVSCVRCTGF